MFLLNDLVHSLITAIDDNYLDLSDLDLYSLSQEQLILLLSAIPARVTHLDLSTNSPETKTLDELKQLINAIPRTITHLDLSGYAKYIQNRAEWVSLLSSCPDTWTITTEDEKLNEFLASRSTFNFKSRLKTKPLLHPTARLLREIEELQVPELWYYVDAPQKQQQIILFPSSPNKTAPEQTTTEEVTTEEVTTEEATTEEATTEEATTEEATTEEATTEEASPKQAIIEPDEAVQYFCVTTSELPVLPLPPSFLQVAGFTTVPKDPQDPKQRPDALLYFKYPEGTDRAKPPISLRAILSDKQYKPTMTQLVDLMTKVSAEMDWLSPGLTFYLSLDTIFITNSEAISIDKPLAFQLCPSGLLMTDELAPGVERYKIHRRMTAMLFLHLATQTMDLNEPMLTEKINEAQKQYPAFIAAFTELWDSTCKQRITLGERTHPMQQVSPTIGGLNKIRSRTPKTWNLAEFSALLSGTACNHSQTMSSVAADALLNLYQNSPAEEKLKMTRHLAQSVELLMPIEKSKLTNPSSKSQSIDWINRMNLISALLQELEHQGDYEALHETQQRLLEAGIGKQLGSNLADHNGKFALSVLVPVVKVSVWMSFQFATLKTRLMFDRNVKKMAQMLFDAAQPKVDRQGNATSIMSAAESEQYILMMLLISDFGSWIKGDPNSPSNTDDIDAKLLNLWKTIDLQVLLDFGLPCCPALLSDETTVLIEKKLEQHITRLIQKSAQTPLRDREQQQLRTSLSYLKSFAWRAHEQVTDASFRSLYTSYSLALIFGKPQQTVFYEPKPLLPIKPLAHSMQQVVEAAQASMNEPHAVSSRQQRKLALSPQHLVGYDSTHQHSVSHHFIPDAATSGAPLDITQFIFSLPEHGLIQYHYDTDSNITKKESIRSLSTGELEKINREFIPTTLSTEQRICTVQDKKTGTQGMFKVRMVDAGASNSVLIGLTSNKTIDGEDSIPGATATSIALDTATGMIHFLDPNGIKIQYPYIKPAHTGSKVCFGITGTQVYCIVDDTEYPPIRGFELPIGADIHPLIRIGCPGVKLTAQVMGALWTLERDQYGSLKQAASNPVAHSLYLYGLRAKECPHYEPHRHTSGIKGFTELKDLPQLIARQDLNVQLDLLMILLARHECLAECCAAPGILKRLISDVTSQPVVLAAKESHSAVSPERLIEITKVLGLSELELAIKQRLSEKPSVLQFSVFARNRVPMPSDDKLYNVSISPSPMSQ
ncbi:MAG: hypothetical protein P4L79_11585 [Legionella sp.]|uniref:hypothetical protein n=1 Tax=Legionella sp. TaxID=459 RepID=UPI00284915D1|nr:hypothetical protein [Legionella sp.]